MKLFIFCVRDNATEQFGTPMFLISSGQAIRSFTDEINKAAEDNMLFKHPDDYDLYLLGEYDTNLGTIDSKIPERITVGKMVKVSVN